MKLSNELKEARRQAVLDAMPGTIFELSIRARLSRGVTGRIVRLLEGQGLAYRKTRHLDSIAHTYVYYRWKDA